MLLNRRVKLMLGSAALVALASAQGEVAAATLEITATVPNACTVESGTVEFGEYVSGQGTTDQALGGGFNVQCSSAASVQISLDGGLHLGQGTNGRSMASPSSNDFLDYDLYKGGTSTKWDPNLALPFTLISGSNPIGVDGRIPENQFIGGGEYSDTVQITLTFQ
jgi:spore coat protein U-like protein